MHSLTTSDLNRLHPNTNTFLGRAMASGRQYGRLPETFTDVLMAFLRIRSIEFAQRYRTGISLGRDVLEQGIRQSLTCMDMGLENAAGGDTEAAVTLLAAGDFDSLRAKGWEAAFERLAEMRDHCVDCCRRGDVRFLRDDRDTIERWARIVPESWWSTDDEIDDTTIDPRNDYDLFATIRARVGFLGSLPAAPLDRLADAAGTDVPFFRVLRHLVVALALDREQLLIDTPVAARLLSITHGESEPKLRNEVLAMVAQQAAHVLDHPTHRNQIVAEVEEEIAFLETHELEEWELLPETDHSSTSTHPHGGDSAV